MFKTFISIFCILNYCNTPQVSEESTVYEVFINDIFFMVYLKLYLIQMLVQFKYIIFIVCFVCNQRIDEIASYKLKLTRIRRYSQILLKPMVLTLCLKLIKLLSWFNTLILMYNFFLHQFFKRKSEMSCGTYNFKPVYKTLHWSVWICPNTFVFSLAYFLLCDRFCGLSFCRKEV